MEEGILQVPHSFGRLYLNLYKLITFIPLWPGMCIQFKIFMSAKKRERIRCKVFSFFSFKTENKKTFMDEAYYVLGLLPFHYFIQHFQ